MEKLDALPEVTEPYPEPAAAQRNSPAAESKVYLCSHTASVHCPAKLLLSLSSQKLVGSQSLSFNFVSLPTASQGP